MRPIVLIAAILIGSAVVWRLWSAAPAPSDAFLGYVEGELLYIGPVEGERLAALNVAAGDAIDKGAALFAMATPLLDEQRLEASAKIDQAQAQLDNLRAAVSRPKQVAVLQAGVARARANLKFSTSEFERKKTLLAQGATTRAAYDQAEAAMARDAAALDEARTQVDAGRDPGRSQEIVAAQAALAQARRQRDAIDTRIKRQSVAAPAASVVQDIFFRPGEMVNAGQPVVSLLPPENRKARFYVPQGRLAAIKLGARVSVACDGCAEGLYGRVSFIAAREEFTPPVIFSDREREKLVFKLEARLEGAARDLPLGLPVALRLAPEAK